MELDRMTKSELLEHIGTLKGQIRDINWEMRKAQREREEMMNLYNFLQNQLNNIALLCAAELKIGHNMLPQPVLIWDSETNVSIEEPTTETVRFLREIHAMATKKKG